MAHVDLIQYEQASEEVKEVFDDIKNLRKIPDVNNFWKCLANHPPNSQANLGKLERDDGSWGPGFTDQGNDLCCGEC